MESKKDIYYQGRIYINTLYDPMHNEPLEEYYTRLLRHITSYEVIGSHSWKDGQEVTGKWSLSNLYNRIVAITLQQPVPQGRDEVVKGFVIEFFGDKSVGIFNQQWSLLGDFYFETKEDEEMFKKKIIEAFEYCSDTPIGVERIEERNKRIFNL